jgi:hypothetical protein
MTLAAEFGVHNINYNIPRTIVVSDNIMLQALYHEILMYETLLEKFPNSKRVYYEEIEFPADLEYKKNTGYENITISNLDELKINFNAFWNL